MLLAVSKTHPVPTLLEVYEAGQRDFGENYVQEALTKKSALPDDTSWHFIGRIQTNKTRLIAEHFAWAHCVDRIAVARRLSAQRPTDKSPLNVCIQVKEEEDDRAGVALDEVQDLAHVIAKLRGVRLRGLMSMPPPGLSEDALHARFRAVGELNEALRSSGLSVDTLSMGMTDDLEIAIAHGATIVRIGTAIFGPRRSPG